MYKVYFKQAIALLKQNKFISVVSIAGTALAIMMVMVLVMIDYVRNGDIAPEINRSKLLYIKSERREAKDGSTSASRKPYFSSIAPLSNEIRSAERFSICMDMFLNIKTTKKDKENYINGKGVDFNYWEIMSHPFVLGKSFTEADFQSGMKKAIICESLCDELYGKNSPIGQRLSIDGTLYEVLGVVKDVSTVFTNAYAEVWVPYTSLPGYSEKASYLLLQANRSKVLKVKEEVRAYERKLALVNDKEYVTFRGPVNYRESQYGNAALEKVADIMRKTKNRTIFLFSILLLIPAINLSVLSMARVKRRMEEIGIRKTYGAKRYVVILHILYENFITTFLGGLIGSVFSVLIIYQMRNWLLAVNESDAIPIDALFSVPILLAIIAVSFILNLFSGGIPTYIASKSPIVDSLYTKK